MSGDLTGLCLSMFSLFKVLFHISLLDLKYKFLLNVNIFSETSFAILGTKNVFVMN